MAEKYLKCCAALIVLGANLAIFAHGNTDATDQSPGDRNAVVEQARQALVDSGVADKSLAVAAFEPANWPNSSLGCPKRGVQYLQVVTTGYRVQFTGEAAAKFDIHVAGNIAVVCGGTGTMVNRLHQRQTPLRNVNRLTELAKQELSKAIGVKIETIRFSDLVPAEWPDSSLGCASGVPATPGRVNGFRIVLTNAGRPYTFHTDGQRVIACPPIADR